MKKMLIMFMVFIFSALLISCKKDVIPSAEFDYDESSTIDTEPTVDIPSDIEEPYLYEGQVLLEMMQYMGETRYLSIVFSSFLEFNEFKKQNHELDNSKVLFDKFDFTQGNLLLYYFNTSVSYRWKDFIFHDLQILDHNITINLHNNSVSDIDLYEIIQNVFILNVPKEIDNSYSFDLKAFR